MSQCSTPLTPVPLWTDGALPPGGVAAATKRVCTEYDHVYHIGHHAGYARAELAHNLEVIRLKGRIQLWRDAAFVAGATALAAIIIIANTLIH